MLKAHDPITWNPQRIAIAGVSGSGKSTLARRIAAVKEIAYVEMDSLYHGPNWEPRPTFVADVDAFTSEGKWVTEWQYNAVRRQVASRADTLVWVDPPSIVTLTRLTRRTVMRRIKREQLWNGNREQPLWRIFVDPDHIIRWGFRTRNKYRGSTLSDLQQQFPTLTIVRLRSQRDIETFMGNLRAG